MSPSAPPTKTNGSLFAPRPWLIAFAFSLALHAGVGVAGVLNRPASRPFATPSEDAKTPYTPATYARKVAEANRNVAKLRQVARSLESVKQQARANYAARTGHQPPPSPATPPPLARPAPPDVAAKRNIATEQARRTLPKPAARVALARSLAEAKRTVREVAMADKAVLPSPAPRAKRKIEIARIKVARYDRLRQKENSPPSGPKIRKEIAYTRVEVESYKTVVAQEKARAELEAAGHALRSGKGDSKAARAALLKAATAQKSAVASQAATRRLFKKDGATIPGQENAQKHMLAAASAAQKRADAARKVAEAAIQSGDKQRELVAVTSAVAAQTDALNKQDAMTADLKGAFGPPPSPFASVMPPRLAGSLPPGTYSPFGRGGRGGKTTVPPPPMDMKDVVAAARTTQARIEKLSSEIRALGHGSGAATNPGTVHDNAGKRSVGIDNSALGNGGKAPASAVNDAAREIDNMVARGQRLLDEAQGREGTAASRFTDRMVALASQDGSGGKQSDVSGYMTVADEGDRITTFRGRVPGDPGYSAPPPPPALPSGAIQAIPGRRVTGEGAPHAAWMYVDSWYVIGPFPNPGRRNINTPFPPETTVDLDASYAGKDGRAVTWAFCQYNGAEMVPPVAEEYAIYYMYTELYFDRPRDAWVAIGSDDQSTLWVDSQMVWKSSAGLKGWQIGEGLRRVHFQAGRNPVLLRVENGWNGVSASVVVALDGK